MLDAYRISSSEQEFPAYPVEENYLESFTLEEFVLLENMKLEKDLPRKKLSYFSDFRLTKHEMRILLMSVAKINPYNEKQSDRALNKLRGMINLALEKEYELVFYCD